jgi:hypothetical protein
MGVVKVETYSVKATRSATSIRPGHDEGAARGDDNQLHQGDGELRERR